MPQTESEVSFRGVDEQGRGEGKEQGEGQGDGQGERQGDGQGERQGEGQGTSEVPNVRWRAARAQLDTWCPYSSKRPSGARRKEVIFYF